MTRFILVSLIPVIFLFSCSEKSNNLSIDNQNISNEYSFRDINFYNLDFNELGADVELRKGLSKLGMESFLSSESKYAIPSTKDYSFRVDSSAHVKKISKHNYTSYTFKIERGPEKEAFIENLVIENHNGNSRALLFSYYPSELWLNNYLNGVEEPFEGEIKVDQVKKTQVNEGASPAHISNCGSTTVFIDVTCACAGHYPGQYCTCDSPAYTVRYTFTYCDEGAGNPIEYSGGTVGAGGGSAPIPPEDPTPDGTLTTIIGNDVNTEATNHLKYLLGTNTSQEVFLNNNAQVANRLLMFLGEENYSSASKTFASDFINTIMGELVIESSAIDFMLAAYSQNKIYNNPDGSFLNSVNQYTKIDLSVQENHDPITDHFITKIAVLKTLNPEWSDIKLFWEASKDIVHISLDAFGMIPVVGEIADLTNGALYAIEGDGVNATLSLVSAVPFVGWVGTATKYGVKVVEAVNISSKVKLIWKVADNGIIQFGQRSQLRKVLGLAVGDTRQAHHIIPWAKQTHPAIQKAAKSQMLFT